MKSDKAFSDKLHKMRVNQNDPDQSENAGTGAARRIDTENKKHHGQRAQRGQHGHRLQSQGSADRRDSKNCPQHRIAKEPAKSEAVGPYRAWH